jgi:hypothetical protein
MLHWLNARVHARETHNEERKAGWALFSLLDLRFSLFALCFLGSAFYALPFDSAILNFES